jgi:predicted metal-binding protein
MIETDTELKVDSFLFASLSLEPDCSSLNSCLFRLCVGTRDNLRIGLVQFAALNNHIKNSQWRSVHSLADCVC